jgi:hypothetical protein
MRIREELPSMSSYTIVNNTYFIEDSLRSPCQAFEEDGGERRRLLVCLIEDRLSRFLYLLLFHCD